MGDNENIVLWNDETYVTPRRKDGLLSDYLNGQTSLSPEVIEKLIKATNYRVEESFFETIKPQPAPDPEQENMQNNELWGAF